MCYIVWYHWLLLLPLKYDSNVTITCKYPHTWYLVGTTGAGQKSPSLWTVHQSRPEIQRNSQCPVWGRDKMRFLFFFLFFYFWMVDKEVSHAFMMNYLPSCEIWTAQLCWSDVCSFLEDLPFKFDTWGTS